MANGTVDIYHWLPSLVAVGAMGALWVDMRRARKKNEESVDKIKSDLKTSLYQQSGITRYVPRGECDKQVLSCQNVICSKIDDLKKSQRELSDQMKIIANHMGRVDQYIKDH